MKISLIVPIKNESDSLEKLIVSINRQVFKPAEVILIDGGSTDDTLEIAEKLVGQNSLFNLIKTPEATPGKGRNIGAENARFQWIAFTDAGIKLDKNWLDKLADKIRNNAETDVVYGNYSPHISNFFDKCLMIAFVPPSKKNAVRDQFIASSLVRKTVWEQVGGFPDLRAAEDNIFMNAVEAQNFKIEYAPEAMVYWKLSPDLSSAFKKFTLYSKHNALIGRQWEWHYGVAKQYLSVILFLFLTVIHSWWWLSGIGLWIIARTAKKIYSYRYELGLSYLFNPLIFFGTALVILTVDMATFTGWAQALLNKEN